jgi:hypothetical protein
MVPHMFNKQGTLHRSNIYWLDGIMTFLNRYSDGFYYTSSVIMHARRRDFLEQAVIHLEEEFITFCL